MKNYCVLLILLAFVYNAKADLSLEINQVSWAENIVTGQPPVLKARIRAKADGVITSLNAKDLIIYENWVDGVKPLNISPFESNWQTVTWVPENIYWDSTLYRGKMIWTKDGESAETDIIGSIGNFVVIRINDQDEKAISEINYGYIPPGNKVPYQIHFQPSFLDKSSGNIHIDSIVTNTKYFTIGAKGSLLPKHTFPNPPCDIVSDNGYYINVMFEPDTYDQYYDILTIYYNHGLKKRIPIFANKAEYEKETVLHLIKPNGSEILTPCEEFDIKWENNAKSSFVLIYYSVDAGRNWKYIDRVKDSVYKWKVPSDISNQVQIKIVQELNESRSFNLNDLPSGINQVAYNQSGSRLLAVSTIGETVEYDLYTQSSPVVINKWILMDKTQSPTDDVFGLDYVSGDSLIAVAYNMKGIWGASDQAYVAYFKGKDTFPYAKHKVMDKFWGKRLLVDKKKKFMVFVPAGTSATLPVYNPKDFSIIKVLKFDYPIIDFVFNDKLDKALISLMDGTIKEISLPDFNISKEFDLSDEYLPIIIGYSPNGRLMSMGFKNMGGLTNNYIFDFNRNHIVSSVRAAGSNPVVHTFSPESRQFVLGSQYQEQLMLVDLTGGVTPQYLASHIDGRLTDVEFAPDAHSLASSSTSRNDNLKFRIFAFPDFDKSDGVFNIVPVEVSKPVQNIAQAYMGTHNSVLIDNVCNTGMGIIEYYNLRLKNGIHFKLLDDNQKSDTIISDACAIFNLDYFPVDIGTITDSLVFTVCGIDYFVPLTSSALPRNIEFTTRDLNFGEVCLGQSNVINSIIFTNKDPVPLIVNKFEFAGDDKVHFKRDNIKDTIVPAGGQIAMNLTFMPQDLGDKSCQLNLLHSQQTKHIEQMTLRGKGIGTFVDVSHTKLLFIPEINTRTLYIINTGETPITFDNVFYEPAGYFETVTQLPILIQGYDTLKLQIRQLQSAKNQVLMSIDATPCLVQRTISLGNYEGTAQVKIADVVVNPNDEVSLPISYEVGDNIAPYKGQRMFEAYIRTNPRLFIPTSISTTFDNAEILENRYDGYDRIFKIRVEGDFIGQGTLAVIKGIPGYAETNFTDLVFDNNSLLFGKSVNSYAKKGSLTINIPFPERKIYRNSDKLAITSLSPNPATDYLDIAFDSKLSGNCKIEVVNQLGSVVSSLDVTSMQIGANSYRFITTSLTSGNYTVKLLAQGNITTAGFLITK